MDGGKKEVNVAGEKIKVKKRELFKARRKYIIW